MRILMISDVYFPRINGVSTSIRTFRDELAKMGHEVTLIAPQYGQDDETPDWVIRVPSRYLPVDPEDRIMKYNSILELTARLASRQFDIVHIQTPFIAHYAGVELSRRLGVPRVETYHTHFEEYLYHYLPWLPRRAMRFAARYFNRKQCNVIDSLIVPSQAMLEVLNGYDISCPITVIATGINEEFFTPGDAERFRQDYGIPHNRPVLTHVGRVAHEKNIDFLLYMLAQLRRDMTDILLLIAGEGPAENHLRKLTRELGLEKHVMFIGYLDRTTTLLDCYRAADVFVFASRTETQGLVLLEAMAQGVPVVSIAELGTRDILGPEQGALVSQEDTKEFAGKVHSILADRALHKRLSEEALAWSRSWSAVAFAGKTVAFYESAINRYHLN